MFATLAVVTVSEKLRAKTASRIADGGTLREISIKAKVGYTTLTRFVSGERGLRQGDIDRLAKYLGLRLCDDE